MKKIFAIAAIAALALTSCVKNEDATVIPLSKQEIGFRSYSLNVAKDTKATEFAITAADFGVFALYHEKTENWAVADQATADNYIVNTKVSYNATDGIWKPAQTYYWPANGGKLSFVAYSPYAATGASFDKTTNKLTIPASVLDDVNKDVMYSTATINKTANDTEYATGGLNTKGVLLLFKHLGSKIKFTVKLKDAIVANGENGIGAKVEVTSMVIKNVVKSANNDLEITYDVNGTPTVSDITTTGTGDQTILSTATNVTATTATAIGSELLVVPQGLGTQKLEVTYTVQNGEIEATKETVVISIAEANAISLTASDNKWKTGYQYTYALTIDPKLKEVWFTPTEEPWTTVNENVDLGEI